ncbi:MAG: sugar transferase [Clostridia bacterium]|nr:sugar transferase [Clostridia bacterium]
MNNRKRSFYEVVIKRFFDFFIALVAILVLSPIFLIVYLLSLLFLGGNPIFKQYRPGRNGKVFPLYKFRSMTNKKDAEGNLLPDAERLHWWGKILRKTSLDELPQLFNILRGDMSIVGPRPRLIKDMVFYPEYVMSAYSVRPGLTGPAQVYDRKSELSWESVFQRDIEYANKVTFWNDLKLFIGTFTAVLKGGSAGGSADAEKNNKREYYYPDQLLKDKKITKSQYTRGLELAKEVSAKKRKGRIEYQADLQAKEEDKENDNK